MEIRDGFIVGVHNYCDRWCERCQLTSYCRVFAELAKVDASFDPNMKAIVEAPLPEPWRPTVPTWMQEMSVDDAPTQEPGWREPMIPPEHQRIDARALAYATRLHDWLRVRGAAGACSTDEQCAVVTWFGSLIAAKINRALSVWPNDEAEEEPGSSDQDGAAKVTLIAIARSHAAWLDLVDRGGASPDEAQPFIEDLMWLLEALEQARPNARRFRRPGFDEPEEVARLSAAGD
jgi:hypothetical protein